MNNSGLRILSLIRGTIFFIVFCAVSFVHVNGGNSTACELIVGTVKEWKRVPEFKILNPIADILIRDELNTYSALTNNQGTFQICISRDKFQLLFEKKGFKPLTYFINKNNRSIQNNHDLGDVLLERMPFFVDEKYNVMGNINLTIKKRVNGNLIIVDKLTTDNDGLFVLSYYSNLLTIEAQKEGYDKLIIDIDLISSEFKLPEKFLLKKSKN